MYITPSFKHSAKQMFAQMIDQDELLYCFIARHQLLLQLVLNRVNEDVETSLC